MASKIDTGGDSKFRREVAGLIVVHLYVDEEVLADVRMPFGLGGSCSPTMAEHAINCCGWLLNLHG